MIALLALAAELTPPPFTVTTSVHCGRADRAIAIARSPVGDAVTSITINGKRLAPAQFAQLRGDLASLSEIDEVIPYCGDGPDRFLIRGRSGSKKRNLMIFFGPGGQVAVREVG